MLELKLFLLCICFSSWLNFSLTQVPDGTPCYTPRQEYGLCINIKNCQVLIDLLRTQNSNPEVRTYLRSSACGYVGKTPMVCCPQITSKSTPTFLEEIGNSDNLGDDDSSEGKSNETTATLLSPPDCGYSNVSNPKVVGGIPAAVGEFPWMVALGYKNSKNPGTPKWLCGGTLITDRHILTAGHCVHNRNDLYLARVGEHDLYSANDGASPEDIPLIKAKIHENYSPVQYINDIALLWLERKPTNPLVWPVCLPHAEPLRSNRFLKYRPVVAGWGAVQFNGPSSSVLRLAEIPVVNNDLCQKAFANKSIIDDRIICAGWPSGTKDACQGDSGGPLMYGKIEGTNLRYFQIGVVSYGFRCAEAGYPGVYTRVTNFLDWIARNLN